MIATRMKVNGISPSPNSVKDARIINANTTLLAPHNAIFQKNTSPSIKH